MSDWPFVMLVLLLLTLCQLDLKGERWRVAFVDTCFGRGTGELGYRVQYIRDKRKRLSSLPGKQYQDTKQWPKHQSNKLVCTFNNGRTLMFTF